VTLRQLNTSVIRKAIGELHEEFGKHLSLSAEPQIPDYKYIISKELKLLRSYFLKGIHLTLGNFTGEHLNLII